LAKEPLEVNNGSCSSIEDVTTPVIFRSKAEQLLGFELIKAMSNFNHPLVAPSLLSTQQNNSLEKKSFEVHLEGNQNCSQQQKIKIKI
jgi:hypothetical protein